MSYYTPPSSGGSGGAILVAKKVLTAAEIHGLDTTPVLIVPGLPGKTIFAIAVLEQYNFGTVKYEVSSVGFPAAKIFYGPNSANPSPLTSDLVAQMISGQTTSQTNGPFTGSISLSPAPADLTLVQGMDIYLVATTPGFNSGAAAGATVTAGNAGLLYALNDTGLLSAAGDGTAVYTVTGIGAGGLVTTVTVTGGNGYVAPALGISTQVSTGIGDGTLELDLNSIQPLGDGTLEIDTLYYPM